ncbi:MAG: SGNH/GDSL hydrolase family protein [Leptolyngbya sp. Prado105]|jgi:lysophospholipase L1-like esterase|nr:SGNH/GDSL hydrolase family protein [Leptolyngbya sp. Prado105]
MNPIKQLYRQVKSGIELSVWEASLIKERMTNWAQLQHYEQANRAVGQADVIFFGDSITDLWDLSTYFPNQSYTNRGISGQTTPQMLVRFRPDVINLHPKVVTLLAGTNDIAGNTGHTTIEQIQDNFMSIAELAKLHQIRLILASILPVSEERSITRPLSKIQALNTWIIKYCQTNNLIYLDYYSSMVDERGYLRSHLSEDGLHPNSTGYQIMARLAEEAIRKAL